jgi:hypothetical protein
MPFVESVALNADDIWVMQRRQCLKFPRKCEPKVKISKMVSVCFRSQ